MSRYTDIIKKVKERDIKDNTKKTYFQSLWIVANLLSANQMALEAYNESQTNLDVEPKLKKLPTLHKIQSVINKIEGVYKLIVALYTLQAPIRVNYINAKVYERKPRDKEHLKENFFVNNKAKNTLTFYNNKHKTDNKYISNAKITMRGQLKRIVKEYIADNDIKIGDTLFEGNFNDQAVFSAHVPKIFEKNIYKHVSIIDIHKIWESNLINSTKYKNLKSNEERQKEHNKLFHSLWIAK